MYTLSPGKYFHLDVSAAGRRSLGSSLSTGVEAKQSDYHIILQIPYTHLHMLPPLLHERTEDYRSDRSAAELVTITQNSGHVLSLLSLNSWHFTSVELFCSLCKCVLACDMTSYHAPLPETFNYGIYVFVVCVCMR